MAILLADIGGTYARFSRAGPDGAPGQVTRLALDAFPDIASLLEGALVGAPGETRPQAAVLAVAGPVAGDRAPLTNRGPAWIVDGPALARRLDLRSGVRVVNDFAALAWALPGLGPADLLPLGGPSAAAPDGPCSVIGPGTGLGVAAFLPPDRVLATEGGHVALAAPDAGLAPLVEALRRHLGGGHVSAERGALSGQGIEALHAALGGDAARRAPEILRDGVTGTDAPSRAAMDAFCALLGAFAGDVALQHGARGGVFIAGGIPPRMAGFLAASDFRARFEAKGRFQGWLAAVPTWLIRDPEAAAMQGLARLARAWGDEA